VPLYNLKSKLRALELNYRVETLNTREDAARWMVYCLKGRKDASLQSVRSHFFKSSIIICHNKAIEVENLRHLGKSVGVDPTEISVPIDIVSCVRQTDPG
jgi:hypothetical protein